MINMQLMPLQQLLRRGMTNEPALCYALDTVEDCDTEAA